MKVILLISFLLLPLFSSSVSDAIKLIENNQTKELGYQKLLDLSLGNDSNASRHLGKLLIYDEGLCKQGLYFLFISSKDNTEAMRDLAFLFKNENSCFESNPKLHLKYLNIYQLEKESKS